MMWPIPPWLTWFVIGAVAMGGCLLLALELLA